MRTWVSAVILSLLLVAFCSPLTAQTYPMPFVSNPLVPAVAAPGGSGFTLTVNGAGFVSSDVMKWNGSARATSFVSNTRLTAQITAADIATAATSSVTVATPNGGTSNSVLFQVTTKTTSLSFTRTDTDFSNGGGAGASYIDAPTGITTIGVSGLAIANFVCPARLGCVLEHSSITITNGSSVIGTTFTGRGPEAIAVADLAGTGSQYLITVGAGNYSVQSGFPGPHVDHPLPPGTSTTNSPPFGDFNGDGHLDLVLTGDLGINILPGNGDGTFGSAVNYDSGTMTGATALGDFNGDGNLDLAVSNVLLNTVSILLGNGDGTFQPPVDYFTGPFPSNVVVADFNGDGRQDLAVVNNNGTVSIFMGNGNGTFQPKVDYPAGTTIQSLTTGDYNGDGVLDLAVSDSLCTSTCPAIGSVNVILGNGDGTFQSPLDFADGGQPGSITTGAFQFAGGQNGVTGRPGFATTNNQQNTISVFDSILTGPLNPIPTVSSISPSSAVVNSGAFTLTVNGSNFISGSTVYFAGQARATTFVSATQLTAAIQASDVSNAGAVSAFVANPAPGGGDSTFIFFNVYGPPPTISSLSPSTLVAGGSAFTLTVNGSNFVNGANVNFNGTARTTAFVSATQLTTAISAGDIANQGTINISVTNPAGGGSLGGTTSSLPLTVLPTNTQPVIGGLVPASATAGGPAFTLALTGSGFTSSSIVTFNSSVVTSAFVSGTQLQAAIPASAIAVGGTPFVTVANPGGVPSIIVSFTVNNPVPGATSISPASVPAGNAATTVNITGTNFNASSKVLANGSLRTTTFVSTTLLNAALLASDFAHSGNLNITVNNPVPGGGTSPGLVVIIGDFNVSVLASGGPVAAGQAAIYTLMVTPTAPLQTL